MATRRSRNGSPAGLHFSRVRLENWRNFVRVETELQPRAFLVGPNASGKSNLLDAFRFLADLVAVGGGLEEAVGKRQGISKLRCLAARRSPDIVIDVTVSGNGHEWRYDLALSHGPKQRPQVSRERVFRDGEELLVRPDDQDRADPERRTQTHLQQVNTNRHFRDLADFFASIQYLHIVPQLVRDPERSVGRRHDPFGGDFLERLAATPEKTWRARLRRIEQVLRVAVPQLSELELVRDAAGTPHLRGRYEHWRPQGAWQTEEQFSDGTLRLFGLLWAMLDGSGPLLLEEPELSLHPDVVRYVPQMLARMQRRSGRQVFISTHSSDLLRDDGIGVDEVLVLVPSPEGTSVSTAATIRDVDDLLHNGSSIADTVIPLTRPANAQQLMLFVD